MTLDLLGMAILKLFKGYRRELFLALALLLTVFLLIRRGVIDTLAIFAPGFSAFSTWQASASTIIFSTG